MKSEETITYLEMTSLDQLRPSAHPTETDFQLKTASARSARRAFARIFEPLGQETHGWTETEWADELSLPGVQAWIAHIARRVAGLIELEASPGSDVGIVVFGACLRWERVTRLLRAGRRILLRVAFLVLSRRAVHDFECLGD
jgi:hypothetical protein